jgi:uncharacterized LabA/DUF88 family protein
MAQQPSMRRAVTFIDGQNLYHSLREAFGVTHPNYDILKLSRKAAAAQDCLLKQARFYTGYPSVSDDPLWGMFWQKKLLAISRQGAFKYARRIRHREKVLVLDDGTEHLYRIAEEKGIDVRIAIDLIRLALDAEYDAAILFSQDQDLSEAVDEIRSIAKHQNRTITVVCAYPQGPGTRNFRGVNGSQWFSFGADFYADVIDPADYR